MMFEPVFAGDKVVGLAVGGAYGRGTDATGAIVVGKEGAEVCKCGLVVGNEVSVGPGEFVGDADRDGLNVGKLCAGPKVGREKVSPAFFVGSALEMQKERSSVRSGMILNVGEKQIN